MDKLKNVFGIFSKNFFEKFFSAWFLSSAIIITTAVEKIELGNINIPVFIAVFAAVYLFVTFIGVLRENSVFTILVLSVLLFALSVLVLSSSIYTYLAFGIIFVLSVKHLIDKNDGINIKMNKYISISALTFIAVFFFLILTGMSVFRYLTFSAPNYDFGIFCNMFHNMKESFRPLVSCERDQILSHFAVHFSPAMYVFLPFYYIFPSPVTVAVFQTVAIYSGIIPFILIMKNRKFDSFTMCMFAVVYAANAAYTGGCRYDFHENCLLVPFMMWMFYFYEKKKLPLMFLFALFTLMVKEDAFIYVSVFAVYVILTEKKFFKGSTLIFMAFAYFAVACYILEQHGTGIMSNRYDAMISGDEGLFGVIKTAFTNPAYAIELIFRTKDKDANKLIYFLEMLCPLAFMPFVTKKSVRLVLVLPLLLNLLTDYVYQYDISFQYNFAIMSLLLYLCVINATDMEKKKRDFLSVTAAGLAAMMFFMLIVPGFTSKTKDYFTAKEKFESMEEVIDAIPQDASVAASTFLIPHLADRTHIYEVYYTQHTEFDYIVLDMRDSYREDSLARAEQFEALGYKLTDIGSEYVFVYTK